MNPELELAKDQLWKFQLRREHAQLLKDMDRHREAFTAFAEEAKAAQESLKEQLTGLKSRFEKLADDNEKQAQEAKDHQRAVEEKVAQLEKIKVDLKALEVRVVTIKGKENSAVEPAIAVTPPAPKISTAAPTKASMTSITHPTAPQSTPTAKPKPAHNVANTGLRKSRRQARQEPSPQKPPTYAKLPDQPLNQDDMSFTDYFLLVDKISSTIDPANNTPLVAMFVTGLAEREQQDAIVDELEKKGMSKVLGNGQVEMKCNWEDFKVVLKTAGLLAGVEKERSHKKGGK